MGNAVPDESHGNGRTRPSRRLGLGGGFPGDFAMGGRGPFSGGRAKVSRGAVRTAVLLLLAEQPMHGYQIMQELSERSGGVWRPSPGSIYPTLQQLADQGLVETEDSAGKKIYHLTDTVLGLRSRRA